MVSLRQYVQELLAVSLTYDVEQFKTFANKWERRGILTPQFRYMSDEVLEITMRKIVVNRLDAPDDKKKEAEEWLLARGYDTKIM